MCDLSLSLAVLWGGYFVGASTSNCWYPVRRYSDNFASSPGGVDIALVDITSTVAHHFDECVWYVSGFC